MEIVFLDQADPTPIYSFELKQDWSEKIRYEVPARLTPKELDRLEKAARECFTALGCRDVARLDFRMDAEGRIHFIECNPLPGLAPGWSDLVLIAKAAGLEYRDLIGEILSFAIRRHQERERERERARKAQSQAEKETAEAQAPPSTPTPTHGAAPRPAEQSSPGPHPAAAEPGSLSRSALGEPSAGEGLRPSPPAAGPLPDSTATPTATPTPTPTATPTATPTSGQEGAP